MKTSNREPTFKTLQTDMLLPNNRTVENQINN